MYTHMYSETSVLYHNTSTCIHFGEVNPTDGMLCTLT